MKIRLLHQVIAAVFGFGGIALPVMAQADAALEEILTKRTFGAAGERVVIQELLEGTEISLHALCDGKTRTATLRTEVNSEHPKR